MGGWLAEEGGAHEAIPDLRRALSKLAHDGTDDAELASLAVVDALIELHAHVPPKEIEPFLDRSARRHALVLMAAAATRHRRR